MHDVRKSIIIISFNVLCEFINISIYFVIIWRLNFSSDEKLLLMFYFIYDSVALLHIDFYFAFIVSIFKTKYKWLHSYSYYNLLLYSRLLKVMIKYKSNKWILFAAPSTDVLPAMPTTSL